MKKMQEKKQEEEGRIRHEIQASGIKKSKKTKWVCKENLCILVGLHNDQSFETIAATLDPKPKLV